METARDRQRKKAAAVQAAQTQSTTQKEAQQSGARDRQRAKAAQVAQQGVKRTKANTKFAEAADRMERVGINTANERSMLDRKLERSRAERAAAHAASQKTLQQDAARVGAQAQRDFAAARETAGGAYSDALNRLLAQHERNSEVAKNLATDDWQKRHGGIAPEDAARTKAIRQAAEIARGDAQAIRTMLGGDAQAIAQQENMRRGANQLAILNAMNDMAPGSGTRYFAEAPSHEGTNAADVVPYLLGMTAAGTAGAVGNIIKGADVTVGDALTGGKTSDEYRTLSEYFQTNPEIERMAMQNGGNRSAERFVLATISRATGIPAEHVRSYLRATDADRWTQEIENTHRISPALRESAGQWAYSIGQQLPGIALTAGAGAAGQALSKAVTLGLMGAQSYGGKLAENAKKYGFTVGGYANALVTAAIETGTELIDDFVPTAGAILSIAAPTELGKNMLGEGFEEAIGYPLEQLADWLLLPHGEETLRDIFDMKEWIGSFASGAIVGGMMGSAGAMLNLAGRVMDGGISLQEAARKANEIASTLPGQYRPKLLNEWYGVSEADVQKFLGETAQAMQRYAEDMRAEAKQHPENMADGAQETAADAQSGVDGAANETAPASGNGAQNAAQRATENTARQEDARQTQQETQSGEESARNETTRAAENAAQNEAQSATRNTRRESTGSEETSPAASGDMMQDARARQRAKAQEIQRAKDQTAKRNAGELTPEQQAARAREAEIGTEAEQQTRLQAEMDRLGRELRAGEITEEEYNNLMDDLLDANGEEIGGTLTTEENADTLEEPQIAANPEAWPTEQNIRRREEENHGGRVSDTAGGERAAGTRAEEQTEGVAGGAGEAEGSGVQSKAAGRNPSVYRKIQSEKVRPVSARELGISIGSRTQNVHILPEESWDAELQELAREVRAAGHDVTFVTDRMEVWNAHTNRMQKVPAANIYGNIIVNAAETRDTARQLVEHELYHSKADGDRGLVVRTWEALTEQYGEAEMNRMLSETVEDYQGIYGREADDMVRYQEEALADLYAGRNRRARRGGTLDEMQKTVRQEAAGAKAVAPDGERLAVGRTTDNRPFVEVEDDILAGVPKENWVNHVKSEMKKRFPDGITVGNNEIVVDWQSRKEMTFSKYTQWLYNNDPQMHADKLRAANNSDEILLAATGWVNEGEHHPRKDKIEDFARGSLLLRVGNNDYEADAIVAKRKNGRMLLYDIVDLNPTSFTAKETNAAISANPSPGAARNTASVSINSIHGNTGNSNTSGDNNSTEDFAMPAEPQIAENPEAWPTEANRRNAQQEQQTETQTQTEAEEKRTPFEQLNTRAKEYTERAERVFAKEIAQALSLPGSVKKEFLQNAVREMTNEYLESGKVNQKRLDETFNRMYDEGIVIDREYYDTYKEVRDFLKSTPMYVEEPFRPRDWNDFKKRAFGSLRLANEGRGVDSVYAEVQAMAPGLFPESIIAPEDQLMRMYDVSSDIRIAKRSLDEAAGADAAEFRKWAKNEWDAAAANAMEKLNRVIRYRDQPTQGKTIYTAETIRPVYDQVKIARREMEKAKALALLTNQELAQAAAVAKGTFNAKDLRGPNAGAVAKVADAMRSYEDLVQKIRDYNEQRKQALRDEADEYLKDAASWKDKKTGLQYSTETLERNIRDIVTDKDTADKMVRRYVTEYKNHEAARNRDMTRLRNQVRKMNLSREVKPGDVVSEAHAVQLYGEAEDAIRMLERSGGRMDKREGKTLEDWRGIIQNLWLENPGLDQNKIRSAVQEFRSIYDDLLKRMNDTRVENGYEPISYRSGYFPHFQPGEGDGILRQFAKNMGMSMDVTSLPTSINGLTKTFKPGIRWIAAAQERLGYSTVYDAVEGFDKYLEGVSDVIYHTGDIQAQRALANQIRYRTTDEGIQKQIDEIRNNPELNEDERQDMLEAFYADNSKRFQLSHFVVDLEEHINTIANKRSSEDRAMEEKLGRNIYNLMKSVEGRVAANMVAINPGSWLTNFIPLSQAWATTSGKNILQGMWDTLKNIKKNDGFADVSNFLTNRRGSEQLVKSYEQTTNASPAAQTAKRLSGIWSEKLGKPMDVIDSFTAEAIVRARYRQNLERKMSEALAMEEADSWAADIMADRSKGATPNIFNARNPLTKAFTQFQLEVNNELRWIAKDLPRMAGGDKKKLAAMIAKFLLGAWLYNQVYEFIVGRKAALDPIGIVNDSVGDFTGYQLPNVFELGIDAVQGDASLKTNRETLPDAIGNLGGNLADELPFLGGLLGGGRIPISSALPDAGNLINAATNSNWSAKKRLATAGK